MAKDQQKKSETLDVRVTYADKQKLLAEAQRKGLTISALLRQIIDQHLRRQQGSVALNWEPIMRFIAQRRFSLTAGGMGAVLGLAFLSTISPGASLAQDLAVKVDLKIVSKAGNESDRFGWRGEFDADFDKPFQESFPDAAHVLPGQRQMRVTMTPSRSSNDPEAIVFRFVIEEVVNGAASVVASPVIETKARKSAKFAVQDWKKSADASSIQLRVRGQTP